MFNLEVKSKLFSKYSIGPVFGLTVCRCDCTYSKTCRATSDLCIVCSFQIKLLVRNVIRGEQLLFCKFLSVIRIIWITRGYNPILHSEAYYTDSTLKC